MSLWVRFDAVTHRCKHFAVDPFTTPPGTGEDDVELPLGSPGTPPAWSVLTPDRRQLREALPAEELARRAQEARRASERAKDPRQLTLEQRVDRLEIVFGIETP